MEGGGDVKNVEKIRMEILLYDYCTVKADNMDWEDIGQLRKDGYKAHYIVTEHSNKDYWVIWK